MKKHDKDRKTWTPKLASFACVCALLSGCASTSTKVGEYSPVFSTDGLAQDTSEKPTIVYMRPGAPGLDAYTSFIIDPVRIVFAKDSAKADSRRLDALRANFREQLKGELRKSGYTITNAPGPATLRISPVISNVTVPGGAARAGNVGMMVVAPITPAVGGVTVETAFTESASNRIDAVVIDRSRGRRTLNPSPWSTEADVRSAFKQWAVGIRKAVDKAHGR